MLSVSYRSCLLQACVFAFHFCATRDSQKKLGLFVIFHCEIWDLKKDCLRVLRKASHWLRFAVGEIFRSPLNNALLHAFSIYAKAVEWITNSQSFGMLSKLTFNQDTCKPSAPVFFGNVFSDDALKTHKNRSTKLLIGFKMNLWSEACLMLENNTFLHNYCTDQKHANETHANEITSSFSIHN